MDRTNLYLARNSKKEKMNSKASNKMVKMLKIMT